MDSANSQSAISVPDHFQKGSSTTERYSYTPTCSDLSYLAEYRSRRRVLAFPRLLGLSALIVISPLLTIASSGGASAVFQRLDTATQGNWRGAYGADGFNVIGDSASVPAYVTATPAGNSSWVWTSSTSDTRALQRASNPADRIAACWYSSGSFTIDLAFNYSNTHQVAVYLVDWDHYNGRTEKVDVIDANNTLLDTRSVASFVPGEYLVWNLSGHVILRVTNTNPSSNAVVSGLFFGTPQPTVSVSVSPSSVNLLAGGSQQFSTTVLGSANTNVTWSLSSPIGTISAAGLYAAPATLSSQQTVTVKTTSVADPTKSASATLTLSPPVTISLTPLSATLAATQTQQYTATVGATSNSAVTWTLSPTVGTISAAGLYTAPATIAAAQTVTVKATSVTDPTKFASATVTLSPATTPYAAWKLDDGSGPAAADSSGNNLTASLFNGPAWLPATHCLAGGGLSFFCTTPYCSVALNLSDTTAVTVSFWLKWNAYAKDDKLALEFGSGAAGFNNLATGFMIDPNSSYQDGTTFEAGLRGNGGYNQVLFTRPSAGDTTRCCSPVLRRAYGTTTLSSSTRPIPPPPRSYPMLMAWPWPTRSRPAARTPMASVPTRCI